MSHPNQSRTNGYGGYVRRNSYALAALATAGIPGIRPVSTRLTTLPGDDIDTALIQDDHGRHWVVSAPSSPTAGARLTKEIEVLEALSRTELAPYLQAPQGFASIPEGGRAAIALSLEGSPIRFDEVSSDHDLAANLGRMIATIHNTPAHVIDQAGVETFTTTAIRETYWANVERALADYPIPAAVAQRWKLLLADDELWEFTPRFIHGSLSDTTVLTLRSDVSGFTNWENAEVADPARDLTWLLHGLDAEAFDAFFTAYTANLDIRPDARLRERTQLVGEFAVLTWLLSGADTGDNDIVAEALDMLRDVDDDLAELARIEAENEFAELQEHDESPSART